MNSQLREASIKNAYKVKYLDVEIVKIHSHIDAECSRIQQFTDCVSVDLPNMMKDLDAITKLIVDIGKDCETCEEQMKLIEQMNANKRRNLRFKIDEDRMDLYREEKQIQLERLKVKLSSEYARKAEQFETNLREKLNIKQNELSFTYDREIDNYRLTGRTNLKPELSSSCAQLSEVKLEQNLDELEAYLQSDDSPPITESTLKEDIGDQSEHSTSDSDQAGEVSSRENVTNLSRHSLNNSSQSDNSICTELDNS